MRIIVLFLMVPLFTEARVGARGTGTQEQQQGSSSSQRSLRERIDASYRRGELTEGERRALMQRQAEIRDYKESALKDGSLSAEEKEHLAELRKAQANRIRDNRFDEQFDPDKMVQSLTNRIVRGVTAKEFTNEEFTTLDNKLEQLKAKIAQAKQSGGAMSDAEKTDISDRYEEITKLANEYRNNDSSGNSFALGNPNDLYQRISDSIRDEQNNGQ